jgi:hypothetical protein
MSDPELIAERVYDATFPDGSSQKIMIGITQPCRDSRSSFAYRCDFVIYWPDGKRHVRMGSGVDSLGALSMALKHWPIELDTMKRILAGKISFLESDDLI